MLPTGLEPIPTAYKADMQPVTLKERMGIVGFEPTPNGLEPLILPD